MKKFLIPILFFGALALAWIMGSSGGYSSGYSAQTYDSFLMRAGIATPPTTPNAPATAMQSAARNLTPSSASRGGGGFRAAGLLQTQVC